MASVVKVSWDLNRLLDGSKPVSLFFWLQPFRLHGYHNCSCSEDMLLPSGPRPPALELRSLSQAEPGFTGRCFFFAFLRTSLEFDTASFSRRLFISEWQHHGPLALVSLIWLEMFSLTFWSYISLSLPVSPQSKCLYWTSDLKTVVITWMVSWGSERKKWKKNFFCTFL